MYIQSPYIGNGFVFAEQLLMRTKVVSYEGQKSLMVYFSEPEREHLESLIPEWKKEYESIATFESGDRETERTLKQIIESSKS